MNRRHVDFKDAFGTPRNYVVWDVDRRIAVGRALVIHYEGEAMLYDIKVDNKYRHQHYATDLIKAMKLHFDSIVTAWYSEAGKKLCLANGFKLHTDGKVPKLVWVKEAKDARKEEDNSSHQE